MRAEKCDGNHAEPRCHASTCWHDDPTVEPKCRFCGAEEMPDTAPVHLRFQPAWRCGTPFARMHDGSILTAKFRSDLCRERGAHVWTKAHLTVMQNFAAKVAERVECIRPHADTFGIQLGQCLTEAIPSVVEEWLKEREAHNNARTRVKVLDEWTKRRIAALSAELASEREAHNKTNEELEEMKGEATREIMLRDKIEKRCEVAEAENQKLREQVKELKENAVRIGFNRFERLCKAEAENQKLRELLERAKTVSAKDPNSTLTHDRKKSARNSTN